jgi:hypothetical protein
MIRFKVIPYEAMRYEDAADWYYCPACGCLTIVAADTGEWRYNLLLLVHETVEALLCRWHGVRQKDADNWDTMVWPNMHPAVQDFYGGYAGDHPYCPYHQEHKWATRVERCLAVLLLVRWARYGARLDEVMA